MDDCKIIKIEMLNRYFKKTKNLGKGGFGEVYQATVTEYGKTLLPPGSPSIVAIKKINISTTSERFSVELLHNEINILKKLNLSASIKYYGCFIDENNTTLSIVMELAQGKDLFDLIFDRKIYLKFQDKLYIAIELAKAISECHAAGLVHHDIKPENIIVDLSSKQQIKVKLIDFGLSCLESQKQKCKNSTGTSSYLDPKAISGDFDSMKYADWWSFGHTLIVLFYKISLYHDFKFIKLSQDQGIVPTSIYKMLQTLTNPSISANKRPTPEFIISTLAKEHTSTRKPYRIKRRFWYTKSMNRRYDELQKSMNQLKELIR